MYFPDPLLDTRMGKQVICLFSAPRFDPQPHMGGASQAQEELLFPEIAAKKAQSAPPLPPPSRL